MSAPHPRMHGLTHVMGGPDPVPFLPGFPSGDYRELILSAPTLWAFWPLDDTGPDFQELVADRDMTNVESVGGPPDFHFVYGLPGPFPGTAAAGFSGKDTGIVPTLGTTAYRNLTTGDRIDVFAGNHPFTVELWVYPDVPVVPDQGGSITRAGVLAALGDAGTPGNEEWMLYSNTSGAVVFNRGTTTLDTSPSVLPVEAWTYVAVTFDGTTASLYIDGGLADAAASSTAVGGGRFQIGRGTISPSGAAYLEGRLADVAIYTTALDAGTINAHASWTDTGGGDGDLVLGLDENGNPAWVQPKVEVTVNGEPADTTPEPPRPDPVPPPDSGGPDGASWIHDQPFTWGGPTFEVPPNKWTTIPFTTPLMERQSTPSGGATTWYEIDWDDPAAAGWIDPATPRVITIPHDIDFNPGDSGLWLQICLKLEIPPVEDEIFVEGTVTRGSHRGLRVFETTHQKSILEAYNWRGACCDEHGAIDVFRDPTKHGGLLGDANMFALGDPGGDHNGEHGNIMIVPNSGYGYYAPGADWLPGHASGNPTLKKGMRLVPQVWHNASTPLTFDCTGVLPYRPHFVLTTPALRSWGPPWSDWPT